MADGARDRSGRAGDQPTAPRGGRRGRCIFLVALLVVVSAGLVAACGGAKSGDVTPSTTATLGGGITVFAASSLTDAFKEAGSRFEEQNPGVTVTFNFGSSSALATQINEGAPADVFASADASQMKVVADKGNASDSVVFATNKPTVIVPKSGSPVATFADLAKPGVRLVLAGPDVPIGRYSRDILSNASKTPGGISSDFSGRVLANLKSNESNVRAVLTKVQLGEAEVGIVYTTDAVVASSDVRIIDVPAAYNVVARYPIAVTKGVKNAAVAKAWVAFILSAEGQAILAKYGFGKP